MKDVICSVLSIALLSAADIPTPAPNDPAAHARILWVHEGDIYTLHCRAMMECSIEAPRGEQFISVRLGDAERWRDSKDSLPSRFYSIKAAFGGLKTDVHLQTDHDNQYGFLIDENGDPDYTVILKTDDGEISKRIAAAPAFISRDQYDLAKKQAADALQELAAVKAETSTQVSRAATAVAKSLPAQMRSYEYDRKKAAERPWEISEILADDRFTYVKRSVRANDLPTVFAIGENGKPEIIVPKYDPDRDLYVIPQRITQGYLSFGGQKKEKRLMFHLPEGA
jgi:type IV secretory pathway VirB9-like protein